jgi:hypothetical protein
MGQQQVHHVGAEDSMESSVPQAGAVVGIRTSGQQVPGGGDPVGRLHVIASGRHHVRRVVFNAPEGTVESDIH